MSRRSTPYTVTNMQNKPETTGTAFCGSLALIGGKIYLGQGRFAQALLIQNGVVVQAGSTEAILSATDPHEPVVNLQGRTALPGFHDSHLHLLGIAKRLRSIHLQGCRSRKELVDRCRAYADAHPEESFLVARGWDQELFSDDTTLPDRQLLDSVTTTRPLIASRICGHILACNTRALELAGITAHTQVEGGSILLGPDGLPNGVLCERAGRLLWDLAPEPSRESLEQALLCAMEQAVSEGLTTVQTNDLREENLETLLPLYQALFHRGLPPLRVVHQIRFTTPEALQAFLARNGPGALNDTAHRFGSIKLMADGSLGSRTALLRHDYADAPGIRGVAWMTQQTMDEMFRLCQQAGVPAIIHAIGDGAITMALDSMEAACGDGGNPFRHGIVHCQITDFTLLRRIQASGAQVFLQPVFINSDWPMLPVRVGTALAKTSYAFGTLLRRGVPVSYGTDAPVESFRPLDNLHCAVNRTDLKDCPPEGWHPEERVTVQQAIDAYTAGGAFASGEAHVKGLLFPGYYGDVTVLDRDIFTVNPMDIRHLQVDLTITGGRLVFQRKAEESVCAFTAN